MDSKGPTPKRNQNKENDEKVTNLSKYKLNESEISLLTKGLKIYTRQIKSWYDKTVSRSGRMGQKNEIARIFL